MEPLKIITEALTTGTTPILQFTEAPAIRAAYRALKEHIQCNYTAVSMAVAEFEKQPWSQGRHTVIEEELAAANAAADTQLLGLALGLLDTIEQPRPTPAEATGIDISHVRAFDVTVSDVAAEGSGKVASPSHLHPDQAV